MLHSCVVLTVKERIFKFMSTVITFQCILNHKMGKTLFILFRSNLYQNLTDIINTKSKNAVIWNVLVMCKLPTGATNCNGKLL